MLRSKKFLFRWFIARFLAGEVRLQSTRTILQQEEEEPRQRATAMWTFCNTSSVSAQCRLWIGASASTFGDWNTRLRKDTFFGAVHSGGRPSPFAPGGIDVRRDKEIYLGRADGGWRVAGPTRPAQARLVSSHGRSFVRDPSAHACRTHIGRSDRGRVGDADDDARCLRFPMVLIGGSGVEQAEWRACLCGAGPASQCPFAFVAHSSVEGSPQSVLDSRGFATCLRFA